ncbi:E3 ubiquitin/ISG15 ligase TRIM25-like isoform X2 [Salminus brasiliensis]|uniref:E3 ubiquitin/ISG15 ligase TRIM25-like isoform X2 n=1 Tax=Salminus brasiliensis TaxID=930266 RepID=UPI003B830650
MAGASISVDQEHFNCSICLQLLKDPVTTPCGHSFCMSCINGFWDIETCYKCPDCREPFSPRPDLRRNNMLAEVVRTLQGSTSKSWDLPISEGQGQDVECDSCVGEKRKAVRTCLTCLASFCDDHLQPHLQSAAFKKHKLVSAFRNLQENTCSKHDNKLLEVFCRTDQSVICSLCLMDNHKGHNTVPVQEEWVEKKRFADLQVKYQSRLEKREKILLELNKLTHSFKCSAQAAVEDSERIFSELIQSIKERSSEAAKLIRAREKAELEYAVGLQEQLDKEKAEINKKRSELDELSNTTDYIHLLQRCQFVSADLQANDDDLKMALNKEPPFEDFKTSVLELKNQMENVCVDGLKNISKSVNYRIITDAEPETREEFLKYARQLTLDPNTVNDHLLLSDCNTKVTSDGMRHHYPDHPERFTYWQQVLCKESVSLRSYWEAEVCGENGVSVAVSYKGIKRNGFETDSRFGHNGESWRLVCYPTKYKFWENNNQIDIPGPASKRIGVYIDVKAGTLSFYGVSNKMTLIHKIRNKFTQPLYPGFGIGSDSSASICLYASSGATGQSLKKKKK